MITKLLGSVMYIVAKWICCLHGGKKKNGYDSIMSSVTGALAN